MDIEYRAVDLPAGTDDWDGTPLDMPIPEATLSAARKAKGALLRTVFSARAEDGRTAALLGYHRPHTSQIKLTAAGGVSGLLPGLIAYAEERAAAQGLVVKTELGDAAGPERKAAEDALRQEHYRQTTDFTCGAVATLDALRVLGLRGPITRADEIALWREATMAVACDPYGLALACRRRGSTPTVFATKPGCVLDPNSGVGILDAALARDTQLAFEREAHKAGIPVVIGPLGVADIARELDRGGAVVVLVDETPWHAERCPHWVTVTRHEGGRFFIDDPWCDLEFGESAIDAHDLVVDAADLELVSSYDGVRSMLAFHAPKAAR